MEHVTSLELDRPQLIATAPELIRLVKKGKREPVLAVDTEAASFHRYLNRIYLVQVSTRTTTSIIDPVAIEDLSPFGEILADPKIEVVFHDADYDLRLFDHQYGFKVRSLFDTRTAAELLSEPALSLAALLERYFDVKIDKRFQRADWSARPLTEEMLAYAAADTRNLVALRDLLAERLEETGRLAWAREEFARLEHVRWTVDEDREPAWLRVKGAKALRPRQLAILRELHAWRVAQATRLDRAEFRILGNDALLAIAREAPESPEAPAPPRPGGAPGPPASTGLSFGSWETTRSWRLPGRRRKARRPWGRSGAWGETRRSGGAGTFWPRSGEGSRSR